MTEPREAVAKRQAKSRKARKRAGYSRYEVFVNDRVKGIREAVKAFVAKLNRGE